TGPLKQYIGTGPYKFAEWIPDRHVKLVRFDTYAARSEAPNGYAGRREALADEVFFYPVSQVATRIAGVQSGDYDLADGINQDAYAQLAKDPRSEERRVGKECRYRWARDDEKKKKRCALNV